MEQDVKENEVLLLRFKYHSFFDLNPKVRPTHEQTKIQFQPENGIPKVVCKGHNLPVNDSYQSCVIGSPVSTAILDATTGMFISVILIKRILRIILWMLEPIKVKMYIL